ncbi:MAG: peptidoglycan DD-metalloendopeptidase family protein [Alphaproteobacteria bacterium]
MRIGWPATCSFVVGLLLGMIPTTVPLSPLLDGARAANPLATLFAGEPAAGGRDLQAVEPAVARATLTKGQTLIELLRAAGAARREVDNAVVALRRLVNLRRLKPGQEVIVVFAPQHDCALGGALVAVNLAVRGGYVVAERRPNGRFNARREAAAELRPALLAELPEGTGSESASSPGTAKSRLCTMAVEQGDTLIELFVEAGSDRRDAYNAAAVLSGYVNPRRLQPGQELSLVFTPEGAGRGAARLAAVSLAVGDGLYLIAERGLYGPFVARRAREPLTAPPAPPVDEEWSGELPAAVPADVVVERLTVTKGDTLMRLLLRAGSDRRDARQAASALARNYNPRRLQVGQELVLVFAPGNGDDDRGQLALVSLGVGDGRYVVADRPDGAGFVSKYVPEALNGTLLGAAFGDILEAGRKAVEFAPLPEGSFEGTAELEPGDTLMQALLRLGAERREADEAIAALKQVFDPRRLKTGQVVTVTFTRPGGHQDRPSLAALYLAVAPGKAVEVGRGKTGGFRSREVETPLTREPVPAAGVIETSLYDAAVEAGVPVSVMMEMIGAFSFDVDFQREIQEGDSFAVIFERLVDEAERLVQESGPLYAALDLSGHKLEIYRFAPKGGVADYFDANGHSVRKALLRTPVDGARITSRYGKRKHPILGYTKLHRGVDFAAPKGSPVVAAGDGVIERIGWNGAYGRYIRIRHNGTYKTAYAHLSRFAKGMKKGKRVRQGQTIGYVGSTGRSTGPHLHYEVLVNNRQINPLSVKLPTRERLKGADLAAFETARREIDRLVAALSLTTDVATSE